MARKTTSNNKTSRKKSSKKIADARRADLQLTSEVASPLQTDSSPFQNKRFMVIAGVVLTLAVLAALMAVRFKSWFIVATVNGSPIFRNELTDRLTKQVGAQMLESMIDEKLILEEARKQNVTISEQELKSRLDEIEKGLGGESLDTALKAQGVSRSDFEHRTRMDLLITKMLSKEVSVSAQEVDEFVKANGESLTASSAAEKRQESEKIILNNKIGQKFLEWFQKAKESAKVEKFL